MPVPIRDIRFACERCGQRIVVDASAAGAETECPGCREPMVIPAGGLMLDREAVTVAAGRAVVLEREIAASRKEITRLQDQLQAAGVQREALQHGLADAAKKLQQSTDDLELAREKAKALEVDALAGQAKRSAGEQELAEARAEIARMQEESGLQRRILDETRAKAADGEVAAQRAAALESEVRDVEARLVAAIAESRQAEQQCETLSSELAAARRELLQTESGRALAELRERFEKTEAERKVLAAQLADAQADLGRHAGGEREWRERFETMRQERDDALSRAEAGSHTALQHGNDVLRGILDRQKRELDERYVELRRLRSAQLGMRLLYAVAVVLFLGAVVLGLLALHGYWR